MTTANQSEEARQTARTRLADTGRNDQCPCGSGKKYKKCHLAEDESATLAPVSAPTAEQLIANAWRLFEQRRPGAAEKEFRAALTLEPGSIDARVGVGMAKLSGGDNDGARKELGEVLQATEGLATELRGKGVKDGFNRKEAQSFIRAAHALGCLAYDQDRFEDAARDLERVYSIDEGPVGTEARLIAGKSLIKLNRAAEALAVLEPATQSPAGGSRAHLGIALARFLTEDRAGAEAALGQALDANQHFGKAILGQIRKRVDSLVGAAPGSREEAVVYAQTYGDVWELPAKQFLEEALEARAAKGGSTGDKAEETSASAG